MEYSLTDLQTHQSKYNSVLKQLGKIDYLSMLSLSLRFRWKMNILIVSAIIRKIITVRSNLLYVYTGIFRTAGSAIPYRTISV